MKGEESLRLNLSRKLTRNREYTRTNHTRPESPLRRVFLLTGPKVPSDGTSSHCLSRRTLRHTRARRNIPFTQGGVNGGRGKSRGPDLSVRPPLFYRGRYGVESLLRLLSETTGVPTSKYVRLRDGDAQGEGPSK